MRLTWSRATSTKVPGGCNATSTQRPAKSSVERRQATQPTSTSTTPALKVLGSDDAGGVRHREDVLSGGSYESSNDQRLHFGIGDSTAVDKVEIHWPSGSIESVSLPAVDRYFAVEEGKGLVPSVYDSVALSSAK